MRFFLSLSTSVLLCMRLTQAQNDTGSSFILAPKPEVDVASYGACAAESNQILKNPAIAAEFSVIINEQGRVYGCMHDADIDESSEQTRITCTTDFGEISHELMDKCLANQGAYVEATAQFVCTNAVQRITYVLKELPDCYGVDCAEVDMERLLAVYLHGAENNFERNEEDEIVFSCKLTFDMSEIFEPDPEGATFAENDGFCPGTSANASPEVCAPLMESSIPDDEKEDCECAAFCGSEFLRCSKFNEAVVHTCIENILVTGCKEDMSESVGAALNLRFIAISTLVAGLVAHFIV